MSSTDVDSELARLRRRVDELEARLPGSSKTTKAQRKALSAHIEEIDRDIKKKKAQAAAPPTPPVKINLLQVGQTVEQNLVFPERTRGKVLYIACRLALPKTKQCDKKTCEHKNKNYVWVMWPDHSTFAYHFNQLRKLTEYDLKPKVGKELSGRIGPWFYDAAKKTWKKDGDSKIYSPDEFADYMYYEEHPDAKDEANYLLKSIMNLGRPTSKEAPKDEEIQLEDHDIIESK